MFCFAGHRDILSGDAIIMAYHWVTDWLDNDSKITTTCRLPIRAPILEFDIPGLSEESNVTRSSAKRVERFWVLITRELPWESWQYHLLSLLCQLTQSVLLVVRFTEYSAGSERSRAIAIPTNTLIDRPSGHPLRSVILTRTCLIYSLSFFCVILRTEWSSIAVVCSNLVVEPSPLALSPPAKLLQGPLVHRLWPLERSQSSSFLLFD